MGALTDAGLKVTIIYQNGTGSCQGPPAVMTGAPALTGSASVWTAGPTNPVNPLSVTLGTCQFGTAQHADVGIADVFWQNCTSPAAPVPLPTDVKEVQGPAQAMIIVVPAANTSFTAMSAEMGQLIWGCGGPGGMVSPFLNNAHILIRGQTSGTQGIVAKAIGVPTQSFFGTAPPNGANGIVNLLGADHTYDSDGIGFIAADLFDQNRSSLNPVAFQAFGQNKAYYADSSAGATDRQNLRDGHYAVWGPEHFYVNTNYNSTGMMSPGAQKFLGSQDGTMYASSFDYIRYQTLAGVVPQCAMKVKRTDDGTPVMPNTPTDPCGCYYEKIRTNKTSCTACPTGNECTGGKTCHHGYCE
jgi:hypothetical protein